MTLFEPGRNIWRMAQADHAAVIVDACDYYRVIRQAMLQARKRILIIGWDFDPRIKLDRTGDGNPEETLGDFLLNLPKQNPELEILILKWDLGALKMLLRGSAIAWIARLAWQKQVRFRLDHAHPTGCSHHQKIVVIDDCFAICGGIDMTGDRWDRPVHADHDPGRVRPNGSEYGPWHDATMAVDGPAAGALSEIARDRWFRATGEQLPILDMPDCVWPEGLQPQFENLKVAVARNAAAYREWPAVKEVEALFVDMIESAQRFIYAENQYFTSPVVAAAIIRRLERPDPPEIVLVQPLTADGWLEQVAMDAARIRLAQAIGRHDPDNRFRIFTPKTQQGQDIYVHAKLMIVDDQVLRVGSSNLNNRSLGLDSECDLALEAVDDAQRDGIAALRTQLMAEHLGTERERVVDEFSRSGSLLATIEALRGPGHSLALLPIEKPSDAAEFIADRELLDPKSPDLMFEGMTHRSLFSPIRERWRGRRHFRRHAEATV
ncbi:phospholipase D-like domain-containing protein [Sphingomonas sp. KRR8]|uniref:phospholipase D-like domain-containing protein n=1 Tax=Sphingomonas sp. KRR8 TaxID=2942996 RepID=UPI002020CCE1|nr:phospholipase D-like domain-containing protein [Sphingomonas sp. KRR8]URD59878.1 phospholipase D-like domain-containing protein [Sphingomonas sp. KRR8]